MTFYAYLTHINLNNLESVSTENCVNKICVLFREMSLESNNRLMTIGGLGERDEFWIVDDIDKLLMTTLTAAASIFQPFFTSLQKLFLVYQKEFFLLWLVCNPELAYTSIEWPSNSIWFANSPFTFNLLFQLSLPSLNFPVLLFSFGEHSPAP